MAVGARERGATPRLPRAARARSKGTTARTRLFRQARSSAARRSIPYSTIAAGRFAEQAVQAPTKRRFLEIGSAAAIAGAFNPSALAEAGRTDWAVPPDL